MSESSTLPLDNPEPDDAQSLVLFVLLAVVPSTQPTVTLEGLEGLAGSHPPCLEVGPGPVPTTNSGVSWSPQVEMDSTPT